MNYINLFNCGLSCISATSSISDNTPISTHNLISGVHFDPSGYFKKRMDIGLPIRYAPVEGVISSLFGVRWNRIHKGIDFKAKSGSPVFAYADGVVIRSQNSESYGHFVEILHHAGWSTLYAHLSARHVKIGDAIQQGNLLGWVGQTGHATGPHVHFEVRFKGTAINPLSLSESQ